MPGYLALFWKPWLRPSESEWLRGSFPTEASFLKRGLGGPAGLLEGQQHEDICPNKRQHAWSSIPCFGSEFMRTVEPGLLQYWRLWTVMAVHMDCIASRKARWTCVKHCVSQCRLLTDPVPVSQPAHSTDL